MAFKLCCLLGSEVSVLARGIEEEGRVDGNAGKGDGW